MNILCIGDIVGEPGRDAVGKLLKGLKEEFAIDFVVANAENSAGGSGLTERIARYLLKEGCDCLTLGDHTWDQKEIDFLEERDGKLFGYECKWNPDKKVKPPKDWSEAYPNSEYHIITRENFLDLLLPSNLSS